MRFSLMCSFCVNVIQAFRCSLYFCSCKHQPKGRFCQLSYRRFQSHKSGTRYQHGNCEQSCCENMAGPCWYASQPVFWSFECPLRSSTQLHGNPHSYFASTSHMYKLSHRPFATTVLTQDMYTQEPLPQNAKL